MELIKDIVKQFYPLLVMLGCIGFVTWMFFSSDTFGKEGIWEGTGKVFSQVIGSDELKNEGMDYIGSFGSNYVPVVKYMAGVQVIGTSISFKDMFSVKNESGSWVSGSTEDDFVMYLVDIKGLAGNSVLAWLSTDSIGQMQEIPAPFVYDKEQDVLYFFGSGTYTVFVKLYGNSGSQITYEFRLPVEVK